MNPRKTLINRAVKTGIFMLGLFSVTQLQAIAPPAPDISVLEPKSDYIAIDEVFLQADTSRNGRLSIDEFYQLHTAAALLEFENTFKVMDDDQSSDVSVEEFVRFLSSKSPDLATEQFFQAAGDDGLMDVKEFSLMRLAEQEINDDLLWKFALLDRDHDGQLRPLEFYVEQQAVPGEPVIDLPGGVEYFEPPVIVDYVEPPTVTEHPEPKPAIPLVEPTVDKPVQPIESESEPNPIKPTEPEKEERSDSTADSTAVPYLSPALEFIGPTQPDDVLIVQMDELTNRLSTLEQLAGRVEKSIARATERLAQSRDEKQVARLERRLQRQTYRLQQLNETQADITQQLQKLKVATATNN